MEQRQAGGQGAPPGQPSRDDGGWSSGSSGSAGSGPLFSAACEWTAVNTSVPGSFRGGRGSSGTSVPRAPGAAGVLAGPQEEDPDEGREEQAVILPSPLSEGPPRAGPGEGIFWQMMLLTIQRRRSRLDKREMGDGASGGTRDHRLAGAGWQATSCTWGEFPQGSSSGGASLRMHRPCWTS